MWCRTGFIKPILSFIRPFLQRITSIRIAVAYDTHSRKSHKYPDNEIPLCIGLIIPVSTVEIDRTHRDNLIPRVVLFEKYATGV
jgi:hypothetical protein